jgi:hypothetical protein
MRGVLATALVIATVLGGASAWAPEQPSGPARAPALPEDEQTRQLSGRDQLRAEVLKLPNAGKLDEAVAAAVKGVCVDHCVLGEDRRIAGLVVGGFLGRSFDLCN